MIIWLNGAFDAGKTTTANQLASLMPGARICDPEIVGYQLMEYLKDRCAISRTFRRGAASSL